MQRLVAHGFIAATATGTGMLSAFEGVHGSASRNMRKELSDAADGKMAHSRK